jgi:hypothetical protein
MGQPDRPDERDGGSAACRLVIRGAHSITNSSDCKNFCSANLRAPSSRTCPTWRRRLPSTGTSVARSLRKKQPKLLDWIAPISSLHQPEKVKMPLLWTSLILNENSNVPESAVVNASPLFFSPAESHTQAPTIHFT